MQLHAEVCSVQIYPLSILISIFLVLSLLVSIIYGTQSGIPLAWFPSSSLIYSPSLGSVSPIIYCMLLLYGLSRTVGLWPRIYVYTSQNLQKQASVWFQDSVLVFRNRLVRDCRKHLLPHWGSNKFLKGSKLQHLKLKITKTPRKSHKNSATFHVLAVLPPKTESASLVAWENTISNLKHPFPIRHTTFHPHPASLFLTPQMERDLTEGQDDEAIIFMDGGTIHSAWKAYKAQTFTAYKRVDRKVKPVPAVFPEDARVERKIPENPLANMPPLPIHPAIFTPSPGGRLTQERLAEINFDPDGFLWPEEHKLFEQLLKIHQNHFVFEDHQRGSFREDYFSPYKIPVVPHIPWAYGNIPIPPGIREKVIQLLREKIAAGVYEPSQSSYRSRWFCVLKKSGKLRIVHDLQPLNKVTI